MKILIADDERPIRDWLQLMVNKIDPSLEIVGTARNGEETLELFKQFHPDILLIDIKMPLKTGLEVVESIRQNYTYPCYVVFLSNHNDFEYVRRSLTLKAEEYILKSEIDPEQLRSLLERAKQAIADQASAQNSFDHSYKKRALFTTLTSSTLSAEQKKIALKKFGASLSPQQMFCICIHTENNLSDSYPNAASDHRLITNILTFSIGSGTFYIFANYVSFCENPFDTVITEYIQQLRRRFPGAYGVSGLINGYTNIHRMVKESDEAVSKEFFSQNVLHFYDNIHQDEQILMRLENERQVLLTAVSKGDNPEIFHRLTICFDILGHNLGLQVDYVQSFLKHLLFSTVTRLTKHPKRATSPSFEEIDKNITKCKTFCELQSYVLHVFRDLLNNNPFDGYSPYVKKAMLYIDQNFMKNITVIDIAKHVNINRDYLCRIMNRELHMTPLQYLTQVRIAHATHLLKTTNLRIQDIAEQSGYTSLSYFSKIFKRVTGRNPNMIRFGDDDA